MAKPNITHIRTFDFMRKKLLRLFAIGFPLAILGWLLAGYLSAWYVTRSNHAEIPSAQIIADHLAEDVEFFSGDGTRISAWWLDTDSDWSVIILPGIFGNRTSMMTRTERYLDQGYNVLLPDLRATGASEGSVVTFGWEESLDLQAAFQFLQAQGQDSIGVHGISLGAATIAYSLRFDPEYQFIVLESPYDNINHAFEHRVEPYPLPLELLSPVRWFTTFRCGVEADSLYPERYIALDTVPTLHIAGDAEQQIPLAETQKIFDNCGSLDKKLHIFEGAGHQDFLKFDPEQYDQILIPFICRFQCRKTRS